MNELTFYTPDNKRKKTQLRVPECHNLHICPPGCGRRAAIRAFKNGEQHFQSFLTMTETDAIFGHHIEHIESAIAELLAILERPRAFVLHFNCVDSFIGTDTGALLERLRREFPGIAFLAAHSDPINRVEKTSMGGEHHAQMYELLEPTAEQDYGVNFIGHYTSLDPQCELFSVLNVCGVREVRELFHCDTFAQYQQMAKSRLNLALMPMGILAAEDMAARLGIPFLFCPVSFYIDEILDTYRAIADGLGAVMPDLTGDVELTRCAIREAVARVGNAEIVVTSENTMRPFSLAETLISYGFNVGAVSISQVKPEDEGAHNRFVREHPDVKLLRENRADGEKSEYIALPIYRDEGCYGLHGIRKLMAQLGGEAAHE